MARPTAEHYQIAYRDTWSRGAPLLLQGGTGAVCNRLTEGCG